MQVELIRRDYVANSGWETFLSYEDPEQGHELCIVRELNFQFCIGITLCITKHSSALYNGWPRSSPS